MPKGIFKNPIERSKKISKKLTGRALGTIHKENVRIAHLGKSSTKGLHWKVAEEKLKRMSDERKGESNSNWRGGKKTISYKEKIIGRKKTEQCEICGCLGVICLDHNHETGKLRGWICKRCNFALGLVKDNCETLLAMVDYLNKND